MAVDDDAAVGRVMSPVSTVSARFLDVVPTAATIGVGSLPHRDAWAAAAFCFEAFDVVTLPSLPRRSPAESPVAQALAGVCGVTFGQYGTIAIDVARLDPDAGVSTELSGGGFVGFRTCLELAVERGYEGPVKWQFIGPISVGLALRRAGAPSDVAFAMAISVVRSHLEALSRLVSAALPLSPQLVVIDEPFLDDLMSHDFPIAPDEAVDLLSTAMAAIEGCATIGVHVCGDVDLATLMASGPKVLSLPARPALVAYAGYIDRFLRNGGTIAWGVVPTEGPISGASGRTAARLQSLWTDLAQRGCDPVRLREQSLMTAQCGLGGLSSTVAGSVCDTVRAVARTVHTD